MTAWPTVLVTGSEEHQGLAVIRGLGRAGIPVVACGLQRRSLGFYSRYVVHRATYASPLPIVAIAFSADGTQLLTEGYHEVLVWDPATGQLTTRVGNMPQRTYGMAVSPDNSWLAVAGGADGSLEVPSHEGLTLDLDDLWGELDRLGDE